MDKVYEIHKTKTNKHIECLVEQSIQSIKNDFWKQIKSSYGSHMKQVTQEVHELLNSSFKTPSMENYEFLYKFENEAKEYALSEIRR